MAYGNMPRNCPGCKAPIDEFEGAICSDVDRELYHPSCFHTSGWQLDRAHDMAKDALLQAYGLDEERLLLLEELWALILFCSQWRGCNLKLADRTVEDVIPRPYGLDPQAQKALEEIISYLQ